MNADRQPAGMFITFEGPEGSGKTTHIQWLAATLTAAGQPVITAREPGDTSLGNAVRALLLEQTANPPCARAEALLFSAARAQLVDEVIRPALNGGRIILCDRYADSTLAYQGYGRQLDVSALQELTDFATAGVTPHLTLLLDIDPQIGLQRKQSGGQAEWNRLDAQTLAFHQAVRRGYLQLAQNEPARWRIIDAAQRVEVVQQTIAAAVAPFIARVSAAASPPSTSEST